MDDIWPSPADDERWAAQTVALIDAETPKPVRRPRDPLVKIAYEATDKTGRVHTKESTGRVYTHLVVILPSRPLPVEGHDKRWQGMGWVTDEDQAKSLAACLQRSGEYVAIDILPVTEGETK